MGAIKTYYGQPSYTISNKKVQVFITVQGGHLTALFNNDGKEVNPFFIAPWWEEARMEGLDEIVNVLRGDFFCFPFGGNEEPYEGKKYPLHGQTSNDNWEVTGFIDNGEHKAISLTMDLDYDEGSVDKIISISESEPVIYNKHIIKGFKGKMPLGHHPSLQLPDRPGAGIIDISDPVTGYTAVYPVEDPKNRGYSLLRPACEISDRSKVPDVFGNTVDLTCYPLQKGFEDICIFISDIEKDFTYTAISLPEEGYLYFQLKDPKVLAETLFWMSNGGRHYAPWNGRVVAVLGMEETSSFFHYGIKASLEDNFFYENGYRSYCEINGESPFEVKLVMGLIGIEKDFKGVQDIIRKNDSSITIIGRGKEKIDVPCRVDFLYE